MNLASKNKGLLLVLSAPSGGGKDTVIAELKARNVDFIQSVSVTTRDIRDGEKNGVDYFFTDVPTFEKRITEDFFLEYVKFGDNYYGTPKKRIEDLISAGSNVLLKIEVQGADNVRKAFPDAITVFIVPPSMEELEKRLKGRGTESEEALHKRLEIARDELKRACEYDYVVVNDTVSQCADRICAIFSAEGFKYEQMKSFIDKMI